MKQTYIRRWLVAVSIVTCSAAYSEAGELIFGCLTRPACGKMCKLVCEEKKLTAVGYGCNCTTICIPGPSQAGCKHCYTTCCCDSDPKGCPPKISFCWYDWMSCGCAAPRQVKVLTKYSAEHKICWYHWEVVDGCNFSCDPSCGCVFKPAPADAQIGLALPLSEGEHVELATWMATDSAKRGAQLADEFNVPEVNAMTPASSAATTATAQQASPAATTTSEKPSLTNRFSSLFKLGK